jgi:eukaryotic-like serine/threonine-protein kinase
VAGEQRLLRRMGPGEAFGETALLLDSPRTASVEAVDMVTALVVNREALEEGLGLDTWLGTLVKALAQRFRELDEKVHGASPAPPPTPGTTPPEP